MLIYQFIVFYSWIQYPLSEYFTGLYFSKITEKKPLTHSFNPEVTQIQKTHVKFPYKFRDILTILPVHVNRRMVHG